MCASPACVSVKCWRLFFSLVSFCIRFHCDTWASKYVCFAKLFQPGHYTGLPEKVADPIILWWTPFTKQSGHSKACGGRKCFFTEDRVFFNHSNLQVSTVKVWTSYRGNNIALIKGKHRGAILRYECCRAIRGIASCTVKPTSGAVESNLAYVSRNLAYNECIHSFTENLPGYYRVI